ncbi:CCA tRNA nucleotidyltransferase [Govanella unica]|uniref:CCA tRNA nucleotidyltransferase n=1 Tax=Govanella unica TaxID=2975056 RepID=A0A9X3TWQ9_9PROT|nr:CCA tRNA nucleotidyltransferase [Govania unica]MDA5193151.1 CCA tRNA nucleotidyltransferase [Govania unica]
MIELMNRDWIDAAPSRAVMEALHDGAGEDTLARFVGGAVRDGILGRTVKDVDIATVLLPDDVSLRLSRHAIKVVPTGIEHGTVTAVVDGRPFEITTLRRDVETDGRRAVVAFTDDWAEDAARRDFTMNALYADRMGVVYDPCGGLADLAAGRVRFVGEAEQRIREDALRILRFFRFHAWYGGEDMDAESYGACITRVDDLGILSVERVAAELLKLLAAPDPMPVLRMMQTGGVLRRVLPEAALLDRLAGLVPLEKTFKRVDALRRLGALMPDGAAEVGERLRLSKHDQERLAEMIVPREDIEPSRDGNAFGRRMRALVYGIGKDSFTDHMLLNWAGRGGDIRNKRWRELLNAVDAWQVPRFTIKGRDAIALGAEAGPGVGDLLEALELWWATRDFKPTRADLLAQLERMVMGQKPTQE